MATTRDTYVKLERGQAKAGKNGRKLNDKWIDRASRAFGVDAGEIVSSRSDSVPLLGYVGAGAAAHLFVDGQGPFERVRAPDGSSPDTVAVEIRGESLGSFFDHWLVYYDDVRTPPAASMLGKLCVCGLADGRILIKKLRKGQLPGHYTLLSQTEEPIYDVILEWCALVTTMCPR